MIALSAAKTWQDLSRRVKSMITLYNRLNGDTLGVDDGKIGVFEQRDKFLESP